MQPELLLQSNFNIFKYIMHIKKNQEVKIPLFNYNVNFLAVSKYLRSKP